MAGGSQRFSRHFHRSARKGLRDRLARGDPDYVPPPARKPADLRAERWIMVALFVLFGAAILGLAVLD